MGNGCAGCYAHDVRDPSWERCPECHTTRYCPACIAANRGICRLCRDADDARTDWEASNGQYECEVCGKPSAGRCYECGEMVCAEHESHSGRCVECEAHEAKQQQGDKR